MKCKSTYGNVQCSLEALHLRGYYVRYADGYESFSPADVFEDGYTAIDG